MPRPRQALQQGQEVTDARVRRAVASGLVLQQRPDVTDASLRRVLDIVMELRSVLESRARGGVASLIKPTTSNDPDDHDGDGRGGPAELGRIEPREAERSPIASGSGQGGRGRT